MLCNISVSFVSWSRFNFFREWKKLFEFWDVGWRIWSSDLLLSTVLSWGFNLKLDEFELVKLIIGGLRCKKEWYLDLLLWRGCLEDLRTSSYFALDSLVLISIFMLKWLPNEKFKYISNKITFCYIWVLWW